MAKAISKVGPGRKPGTPKTGGRKAGTPNKSTAELKELARQYTNEALEALVNVIRGTDSDAARVSAIRELFDRGYGKATQTIGGDADKPLRLIVETGVVRAAG